MLNMPNTLSFCRYMSNNGQYTYGVRGTGLDYQQFLSDLFKLDVLVVDKKFPWVYWTFQNPEDEVDFVVTYKENMDNVSGPL